MIGNALGVVLEGIDGLLVQVEADVHSGFPQFSIVGLPDSAVSESKLRIRSAIRNAGLEFPKGRITVNLSPASMRKRGAGLDLAIAIAILRASGQVPPSVLDMAFCAELALSSALVEVPAALNLTLACLRHSVKHVVVATGQSGASLLPPESNWLLSNSLREVSSALRGESEFNRPQPLHEATAHTLGNDADMSDVIGLETTKRALLIAAAGRHHTLLVGPPGCGKTMLAERFSSMLPQLSPNQALEVYAIQQAYQGKTNNPNYPPMRNPHHSLTAAGLIGGGNPPHPGEVSFAHNGVLILDELLEFTHQTLESLREPLSQREVFITRAGRSIRFPSDFILLATTNPCPCGKRGFAECICPPQAVQRYWSKLSGPLLDRIDLLIQVEPRMDDDGAIVPRVTSRDFREYVTRARKHLSVAESNMLSSSAIDKYFSPQAKALLDTSFHALNLSRRGLHAIMRVAKTIAALADHEQVQTDHIQEAIMLRNTMFKSTS